MPAWLHAADKYYGNLAPEIPTVNAPYSNFRLSGFILSAGDRKERSPTDTGTEPKFQTGLGATWLRFNRTKKSDFGGGVMSGSWARTPRFRWISEFGIHGAASPLEDRNPADSKLNQVLFQLQAGPELTRPRPRGTLFVHVVPGLAVWGFSDKLGAGIPRTEAGLSIAAGGGIDLHMARHYDLHLAADYMPTWLAEKNWAALNTPLPPNMSPYRNFKISMMLLHVSYYRSE
jgi:hypothetical protein